MWWMRSLGEMAYEDRLKRLKLPTLSYRHLRGDMMEIKKSITSVYDRDDKKGLFNLRIDSNTRGQRRKIFKERPRYEVRKHSFFFRVTDPWNSLLNQVVEKSMVETFETRLVRR